MITAVAVALLAGVGPGVVVCPTNAVGDGGVVVGEEWGVRVLVEVGEGVFVTEGDGVLVGVVVGVEVVVGVGDGVLVGVAEGVVVTVGDEVSVMVGVPASAGGRLAITLPLNC